MFHMSCKRARGKLLVRAHFVEKLLLCMRATGECCTACALVCCPAAHQRAAAVQRKRAQLQVPLYRAAAPYCGAVLVT